MKSIFIYLFIILALIVIDQVTKIYVLENIGIYRTREISHPIYFKVVTNKGVAYSLLQNKPKIVIVLNIIMLSMCTIFYIFEILEGESIELILAMSFVLSGGMSNLLDRLRYGYVVDYIYIKVKFAPIFNCADIFILLGCLMMLFYY